MSFDDQHKWQGLTISPLLGPKSLGLHDKKDQISSLGGHMANFTCRKLCEFHSSVHNRGGVTFKDMGFIVIVEDSFSFKLSI